LSDRVDELERHISVCIPELGELEIVLKQAAIDAAAPLSHGQQQVQISERSSHPSQNGCPCFFDFDISVTMPSEYGGDWIPFYFTASSSSAVALLRWVLKPDILDYGNLKGQRRCRVRMPAVHLHTTVAAFVTLLYILASSPLRAVSHIALFVHTDAVDQHRQYRVGIPLQPPPQTPQASDSARKERASGIKRMAEN
jgi:hypothetical protein